MNGYSVGFVKSPSAIIYFTLDKFPSGLICHENILRNKIITPKYTNFLPTTVSSPDGNGNPFKTTTIFCQRYRATAGATVVFCKKRRCEKRLQCTAGDCFRLLSCARNDGL